MSERKGKPLRGGEAGRGSVCEVDADPSSPSVRPTDNSFKHLISLDDLTSLRVTQIAQFAACPRRWRANVLGEGEQSESPYARIGTAVHLVIERYLRGEFNLDSWLEQALYLEQEGVGPKEREHTRRYCAAMEPIRRNVVALEQEMVLEVRQDGPTVKGHIDAIFIECDANGKHHLIIRDHKTNRSHRGSMWWREQIQPRLYAAMLSLEFKMPIHFEIGYVNLGEVVRWTPTQAEMNDALQHSLDVWDDIKTYKRMNFWPEFINDECSYCPLRNSCATLKESQRDFLGKLGKKRQEESVPEQYLWATAILKTIQTKVDELKAEMIEQAKDAPVKAGDNLFIAKRATRREVDWSDVIEFFTDGVLDDEGMNRLFSVRLGVLDELAAECGASEEVMGRVRTVESEAYSLSTKKVGKNDC